ncbi:copper resistance CopC family protein [Cellulomonas telluris]|uniref:copper resistance CopC family protein n=1 Tax=Cellulomonas telluris TaxID=2306636 RepID=UPI0014562BF4|nr:copper resistance CopC family protein [Cellulomonas telluris]
MRPSSRPVLAAAARRGVAPVAARPAPWTAALALLVALAAAVTALLLTAAPASAHNALRSTDPADGSTVEAAPAQVTLTFDQAALELGSEVVVTAEDGTVVSAGPVQLADTSVVQPLAEDRPAGAYRVDWRVTSADGHPISGTFAFTATTPVGPAAASAADATTTAPTTAPTEEAQTATPTAEAATTSATDEPTEDAAGAGEAAGTDGGPGRGGPWLPILLIVAVIVTVFTVATLRRRRRRGDREGGSGEGTGAGPSGGGPTAG